MTYAECELRGAACDAMWGEAQVGHTAMHTWERVVRGWWKVQVSTICGTIARVEGSGWHGLGSGGS